MNLLCPKCKSKDIAKKGFRFNAKTKKQKYQCCSCKHWFIEDDGFKRMRHSPDIIRKALSLIMDAYSLRKAKNYLWQHEGINVSVPTLLKWIKKYSFFFESGLRTRNANTQRKAASR